MSWLVAHDVNEGREHMNFSTWGRLSSEKRVETVRKIREEVSEGHMPPAIYLPAHPEARLNDQDKAAIEAWAGAAAAARGAILARRPVMSATSGR